MKPLLTMPIRGCWQHIGNKAKQHEQKVHKEAQPYYQSSTTKAPHLNQTVVDDVRYGKNN